MDMFELLYKKKIFSNEPDRYDHPHQEAMRLRYLWSYGQPSNKCKDIQELTQLYKEASACVEKNENLSHARRLITKGLLIKPRYHALYALRGIMAMREGKWTKAIKNYETARAMMRLDKKTSDAAIGLIYNKPLIKCYWNRGKLYFEDGLLLEAAGDFEQILVLKVNDVSMIEVQDKLLQTLKKLEKYEAFCLYWNEFMKNANPTRTSDLLTQHAEYKFHLREIQQTRQLIFEALRLNNDNMKARKILQDIHDTGHAMASNSVIWCMHACYGKALITIEKARECDPYNPGFALLKTIVLRLSGRLNEASIWLDNVDKNFYKLLERPRNKRKSSIIGTLSIEETRNQLIKQWYLIRYDLAVKYMTKKNYEKTQNIIERTNFKDKYMEPYMLLGDSFLLQGKPNLALQVYLRCREKSEGSNIMSKNRRVELIQRIGDILNSQIAEALEKNNSKRAVELSNKLMEILNYEGIEPKKLGIQRGIALMHKARAHLQMSKDKIREEFYMNAAESLKFTRGAKDGGLYYKLYDTMTTEEVIDRFAPKRNLPHSLKILMQYS